MQASKAVVAQAGGAWGASLNHYEDAGGQLVTTVQVDEWVYVVGESDFSVRRYGLSEWIGGVRKSTASVMEADDATMALELLNLVREDCLVWQCGSCADGTRGWIYTSNRPRIGVLRCSSVGLGDAPGTCGRRPGDERASTRASGSVENRSVERASPQRCSGNGRVA